MTLVNLTLKIHDALIKTYIKAQQSAEQGSDFLRIFHNGRADALHDAENIVNNILCDTKENILLNDTWNPISKIPKGHCTRVIIHPSNPDLGYIAYYSNEHWYSDGNQKINPPTHWMYIPEGPK